MFGLLRYMLHTSKSIHTNNIRNLFLDNMVLHYEVLYYCEILRNVKYVMTHQPALSGKTGRYPACPKKSAYLPSVFPCITVPFPAIPGIKYPAKIIPLEYLQPCYTGHLLIVVSFSMKIPIWTNLLLSFIAWGSSCACPLLNCVTWLGPPVTLLLS